MARRTNASHVTRQSACANCRRPYARDTGSADQRWLVNIDLLTRPTGTCENACPMRSSSRSLTLLIASLAFASACEPVPARVLNEDEKLADMLWMYSMFDENYAPRELKEASFGFDYETLKDDYLAEALATTDNEAFYAVMHRFVAEFHDAHTSSSLVASTLPGRTKIAYLGFSGVRFKNSLIVTELLPTTAATSSFPVHVGDEIVKLDGKPLRDIVLEDMVAHRDLGYDEANLTFHMNGIFTRTPLVQPLPTKTDAVLTVKRAGSQKTIKLPWIFKDLQTFIDEQSAAAFADADTTIGGIPASDYLVAAREILDSDLISAFDIPIAGLPGTNTWNHFQFFDNMPTLTSPSLVERVRSHIRSQNTSASVEDIEASLSSVRNIPPGAIILSESPSFPTYIAQFPTKAGEQRPFYAYMLLSSFTPADEQGALDEISAVLSRLSSLGVKHLIIDTIDNGGGSLSFGMRAAQLLSRKPLKQPQIRFKISETWIDKFERDTTAAPSDTEKELARRLMEQLKADRAAGKVISDAVPIDALMPFQFEEGNESLGEFKIALLVNEMCVSMCDIFAATLKDNKLAKLIGKRTMGGGGNVVQHAQAPNSHLALATTESLILRNDGTPIENVGVTPHIQMAVNETAAGRYDAVRDRAIELLNPCQSDCVPADDLGGGSDAGGCSVGGGSSPAALAPWLLFALGGIALSRRITRSRPRSRAR